MTDRRLAQVFPSGGVPVAISEAYADAMGPSPTGRPHVTVNMVTSVDGGTAVSGVTGSLSTPADRDVFRLLRAMADVVLVGAETVRAEGYGSVKADAATRAAREARGQRPAAALAIVTQSLRLDWSSALFTAATARPFVIAPEGAPPEGLARAREVATVVLAGKGRVDLAAAVEELGRRHGIERVLCEGGPTLNASLARLNLIDQLCLTQVAVAVGGGTKPILGTDALPAPRPLRLVRALLDGSDLFLRYAAGAAHPVDAP